MKAEGKTEFGTGVGTLMKITLAPTIWAFHFVICYGAAAVWCEKWAPQSDMAPLQIWLIGLTLAALAGILICGVAGWRGWTSGGIGMNPHITGQGDTESRNRFLGQASVLLAVVSFIGVIYVVLPILLVGTCT
ncbi:hypothetical protein ACOI1H_11615 [Loktanella sp. DJP18]|uniref:hypothetical protein n=1 Tax=Loktanella sp. DJP18 TaxID=3409788 RepID=UPI003BB632C2